MKINSFAESLFSSLPGLGKNRQSEKTAVNDKKDWWNEQVTQNNKFDFAAIQKNAAQSKKQAIQSRMAMLKAQLEAMLKFAASGTVSPRLLSQLARELKSLVAQYSSISGGGGGSAVTVPQINVSTEGDAKSTGGGIDTAAAVEGVESAAVDAVASGVSEAEIQAATAAANEVEDAAGIPEEKESDETSSKTEASAELRNNSAEKAEDRAFMAEAKRLAQMIKILMEKAKKPKNEMEAKELKQAQQDIKEMDEMISKVEKELFSNDFSGIEAGDFSVDAGVAEPVADIGNVSIYV